MDELPNQLVVLNFKPGQAESSGDARGRGGRGDGGLVGNDGLRVGWTFPYPSSRPSPG